MGAQTQSKWMDSVYLILNLECEGETKLCHYVVGAVYSHRDAIKKCTSKLAFAHRVTGFGPSNPATPLKKGAIKR